MKPEELYKKEFGDAESIPKESVIRLLNYFAKVLKTERQTVKNNGELPHVEGQIEQYTLECKVCGKSFGDILSLYDHYNEEHN